MTTSECTRFEPAIDDALDGRLALEEATALAEHLANCADCRALDEQLRWARGSIRAAIPSPARDEVFEARLRAALDAEPAPARISRRRLLAGAAALAAGVAAVTWLARRTPSGVNAVGELLGELRAFTRDPLPPAFEAADASALEARFASAELGFPTRVIDLSAMQIRVLGGSVRPFLGHASTLVLYQLPEGGPEARVLCRMLRGGASIIPARAPALSERGFDFVTETHRGASFVFWREGEVTCVLAAFMPVEGLLGLAREKAMAP